MPDGRRARLLQCAANYLFIITLYFPDDENPFCFELIPQNETNESEVVSLVTGEMGWSGVVPGSGSIREPPPVREGRGVFRENIAQHNPQKNELSGGTSRKGRKKADRRPFLHRGNGKLPIRRN